MKHIVKRGGHTEAYDERKLYGSVYAAALAVREPAGSAELIASQIVAEINQWLGGKQEVTANDIRRLAADYLKVINPDAAQIYRHHRVVW